MSGTSSRTTRPRTWDLLVDVAGAGSSSSESPARIVPYLERLGEAYDALLVGARDHQGAVAVGEQLLEHDDLADLLGVESGDHVEGFVEHDLLATEQVVEVNARADVTRSLRPPVKTSIESSSLRLRKVPKPAGGWASRSTSSLSFMIWSRASRRVCASRSFCEGEAGEGPLGVRKAQLQPARNRSDPGTSRRRRSETFSSRSPT